MTPDQISALINQLLKTGEILATKAFELAVRQVYVATVGYFMAAITIIVVGFLLNYWEKKTEDKDAEYFCFYVKIVLWIVWLFPLYGAIARLINPQWYAVKVLLETFIK